MSAILCTLSDEELAKVELASDEEIAHALRIGQLEAQLAFPARGANVDQLRYELDELRRSAPMRMGRRKL
jgi:hypothetical protein